MSRSSDYAVLAASAKALRFLETPRTRFELGAHLGRGPLAAYRLLQALIALKWVERAGFRDKARLYRTVVRIQKIGS